ncbi:hypothetical protein [Clostridium paraputrificum]|uniref:hypothetical protein n=1 Tax=Clostridium paraputrificum TaxID=29363 RepID=UPI002FCD968A
MAKKYRTKHDKMINSIIKEFGQLNAHDMVYAEELLIYSKMQKKLQKCLNKELKATIIDQKEVSTIIKNIVAMNNLITDRMNYFQSDKELDFSIQ